MKLMSSSLPQIYQHIIKMRQKYGDLKKCEIHLHTPASYDYSLIEGEKYKTLELEKILDYCQQYGYLNQIQTNTIRLGIENGDYDGLNYIEQLREKNIPYKNFKEYLSYMLIAHKLYSENIEVVLISDHNTIAGYKKLKFALDEYFKTNIKNTNNRNRKAIYLLLGIEITCSDKNHVVGIFKESLYSDLQKFIDQFIYSIKEGTIETGLTIINEITKLGGIGYIAHINSSDFLGTGLYKQNLFSNKILGSTNLNSMPQTLESQIYPFVHTKDFCILHEGDSHYIDAIGRRNSWIKFSDFSFSAFKKAIIDHDFSVYTEKPPTTDKFIKGIYINPGKEGYMRGRNETEDFFVVDFSKDLNCIIGGRGTGKSTLLNIIDTIFSRTCLNKQQLRFISDHKYIVIVFTYLGIDYLVRFVPQLDPDKEYYQKDFFLEKAFKEAIHNKNEQLLLSDHWLELYKVEDKQTMKFVKIIGDEKNNILDTVYRNRYSINNIIQKIDKGEIGDFVKDVIFDGLPSQELSRFLQGLNNTNQKTVRNYLKDQFPIVLSELEDRKRFVGNEIDKFNEVYKDLIKIEYGSNQESHHDYIDELLFNINRNEKIKNTLLDWAGVERYLYQIIRKVDFITFLDLLVWHRFSQLEKILPLSPFAQSMNSRSERDIFEGYAAITQQNIANIYRSILKKIVSNINNLHYSLKRYLEVTQNFNILFNVNSKESTPNQGVLLKPIETLSLGQKVAAILTFIFKFGIHAKDNTPLIIDQPEDNLDSQYIYKNLVSSLREIKNARQVIIVTHNSTIVTNAVAEQVIVLNSDNQKGWVEYKGFQGNRRITQLILQYLEGGEESFFHKIKTYDTILELQHRQNI
ncbi:Spaf_1101 family AAA-like ATPase [Bacillus sp. ISL-39]|uniref:Spaf_1101 family AAA-like ATPase n=1 Tax=Bacillus sp. ISL-39 TaxID=2819124 RepID=UPI001BEAF1EF|nr:AAA family ATPase [Bacillus sp. ISL-39]MBT2636578.1 AAA family ATPase [Bacillus sp. ISL-39]